MTGITKIQILHVSTAKTYRGGEQQIFFLAKALEKQKVKQDFLLPEKSELATRLINEGFSVNLYQKISSISISGSWKMAQLMKRTNYDVVNAHDSHALNICWLSKLFLNKKFPIVYTKRNAFPPSKSFVSKRKYNSESIKKIICISSAAKESIKNIIVDESKIEVIPDGIDLSIKSKKKLDSASSTSDKNAIVVSNIGALTKEKDQITFIRCAQYLLDNFDDYKFHFFVAGEGPEEKHLRSLIAKYKIVNDISLLGYQDDIYPLLNSTDILVHTANSEGLGTILLQALAQKIPIVATNAGGIPDIIKDELTGLIAPIGDFKLLAKAVVKLLENTDLKNRIIHNGHDLVMNYSIDHIASKTMQTYSQAIQTT